VIWICPSVFKVIRNGIIHYNAIQYAYADSLAHAQHRLASLKTFLFATY